MKYQSDSKASATPQSMGGKARAQRLGSAELTRQARQAAKARWEAVKATAQQLQDPSRVPEALCEGLLEIGSVLIECYVLDRDQKRVIHKRGMAKALGMKSGGGNVFMRAMQRKGLGSEISDDLRAKINNPIVFKPLTSDLGHGYDATILIDICQAILDASKAGRLRPSQQSLAVQAEIIIRASAKLGIIALVDDATGFIADKRREQYKELFREFIRDEFKLYDEAQFPDQLFDVMYKIYGLPRKGKVNQHPRFFGKFIRKYIYEPLASSNGAILEMLDEKNPVAYVNGGRRYKMYQFMSEVVGMNALKAQLWQVIGIGNSVRSKNQFERSFRIAFPSPDGGQLDLFTDHPSDE